MDKGDQSAIRILEEAMDDIAHDFTYLPSIRSYHASQLCRAIQWLVSNDLAIAIRQSEARIAQRRKEKR